MQLERVGELMGELQNHASSWERPPGFIRSHVDYPIETAKGLPDPFAPEVIASIHDLVSETLSAKEAEQITAILERVRAAEESLGQGPDAFGLIHADLHYYNLLFEGETVRAIDFDDCGFGPHLYDLAVMLSQIWGRHNYAALRAGLLAGYRRVHSLPLEHEPYLDAMIALRQVQDLMWILVWRKHPALREDWQIVARRVFSVLATNL